ncbi:MAG: dihydrolipoyl dehydrogenase [Chloroflexota bacterium]
MAENSFDLVVLGAGPGGYHAAIRGAQLGLKTAVVEKDDGTGIGGLGGVCLNWGCIPSKSLLKNAELLNQLKDADEWGFSFDNFSADIGKAVDRSRKVSDALTRGVSSLMKKNKIEVFRGKGRFTSANTVEVEGGDVITGQSFVIATGARPRSLPGLEIDEKSIITSRQALELREAPDAIGIVGGGAIGVEFAYYYRAYGSEVTVFEMLDHLVPNEDEEVSQELERAFKKQGINYVTGARVQGTESRDGRVVVKYEAGGETAEFECDRVLLGVGVQPNSDDMGLDEAGVEMDDRGFITIDEKMRTSAQNIYAVGDVTGKLLLAHVAFTQGVVAAETIKGLDTPDVVYTDMPRATYCQPQVASIGLTEAQAREQGMDVEIGKFPFRGAGKAVAIGDYEGFVKIISDKESGEILGAHMIGPDVTELLAEIGVIKTLEGTPVELGWTTHAHPTLSEAVKEAGLAVSGEAIHA